MEKILAAIGSIIGIFKDVFTTMRYSINSFTPRRIQVYGNSITLDANGTGTVDIQLGHDNDWVVQLIKCVATSTAFTCKIVRDDVNESITDIQLHSLLLFTDADAFQSGLQPFHCRKGTRLRFELTDLSTAENTVKLAAHCRAV